MTKNDKLKLNNDNTIYTLKDLIDLAHTGYFPFKSRSTIIKLVEQKMIPVHRQKIGKKYYSWWFIGHELVKWLEKTHKQ